MGDEHELGDVVTVEFIGQITGKTLESCVHRETNETMYYPRYTVSYKLKDGRLQDIAMVNAEALFPVCADEHPPCGDAKDHLEDE